MLLEVNIIKVDTVNLVNPNREALIFWICLRAGIRKGILTITGKGCFHPYHYSQHSSQRVFLGNRSLTALLLRPKPPNCSCFSEEELQCLWRPMRPSMPSLFDLTYILCSSLGSPDTLSPCLGPLYRLSPYLSTLPTDSSYLFYILA